MFIGIELILQKILVVSLEMYCEKEVACCCGPFCHCLYLCEQVLLVRAVLLTWKNDRDLQECLPDEVVGFQSRVLVYPVTIQ